MLNKSVTKIERTVYSIFMLFGDIGGLYGLLVSLSSVIVGLVSFQSLENQLVGQLYLDENVKPLKQKEQGSFKELCQSILPLSCLKGCCCNRSRRDIDFERARDHLNQELELVTLLQ